MKIITIITKKKKKDGEHTKRKVQSARVKGANAIRTRLLCAERELRKETLATCCFARFLRYFLGFYFLFFPSARFAAGSCS